MHRLKYFVLGVLLTFNYLQSSAQVSQLGLGFGGSLMDYYIDQNETIWVGVDVSGLYKSDDRGASWERMNNQPVSEHISEIFVHPEDENLLLLGTRGALLRSTDRGESWTDIRAGFPDHRTSGKPSLAIVSIIVDPHNSDVLFAAQGDRREAAKGSISSADLKYGKGTIYKSEDRGLTWTNLRDSYGGVIDRMANIFSLAASNQVKGVLFAASSKGLYKSTNGGSNFKYVHGLPHDRVTSIAISPSNNNEIYVTLDYENSDGYGVFKSEDFGKNWESANDGIPQSYEGKLLRPYHLIVDWKNNKTVYMASTESGAIWKTTNGGESWNNTYRFNVETTGWGSYGNKYLKAYGFAMSPIDSKFLIAGEHWSHKTEDGGDSWYQVYSTNTSPYQNNGADFTVSDCVVPSPINEGMVLMGQYDNGLYLSNDHGNSWENKHNEMRKDGVSNWLLAVTDVDYASNGDIYVAVELSFYEANAGFVIKKSTDNGKTWSVVLDAKKGSEYHSWGIYHGLEVHPTDPNIIYVTSFDPKEHMTIKSVDGGVSWTKIGNEPPHRLIRQLEIDDQNPSTLYAVAGYHNGNDGRIYKSTDAGVSWVTINETPLKDPRNLSIDPANSDILYLAQTPFDGVGGVYKSEDGGKTWVAKVTSDIGAKSGLLSAEISVNDGFFGATSVAVHPDNSSTILATFGAATGQWFGDYRPGYGLALSKDGGDSWDVLGRNRIKYGRLNNINFDPFDHNIIYTGSGGSGGFRIDIDALQSEDDKFARFLEKLRSDPASIEKSDFEDLDIDNIKADNIGKYQTTLSEKSHDLFLINQVQVIIDSINGEELSALEKVQEKLDLKQAYLLTNDMLSEAGVINLLSELLFEYHKQLNELNGSSSLSEIQEAIDAANVSGSLVIVNSYFARNEIGYPEEFFDFLNLKNINREYEAEYTQAFLESNQALTIAEMQTLIDQVNEDNIVAAIGNDGLKYSLYPNPVENVMTFEARHYSGNLTSIVVMDMAGKEVRNYERWTSNIWRFSVSDLTPGLYLLTFKDMGVKHTMKFMKK